MYLQPFELAQKEMEITLKWMS